VMITSIVDSGVGILVFGLMKKEDEDRRVLSAALAAICNMVNKESPLRDVSPCLLDESGSERSFGR
jgi:armadillo repeat-containing protein 8